MSFKAQWGPMGFIVSPTKIVPFEGLSTSITLKTDNGNNTSGAASTNSRGRELQPMTFTTTYMKAAGVDPRQRFEQWEALVGSAHPLYIGEKRFGPAKMLLKKVDLSDLLLSDRGEFLSITLTISLEEYTAGTTTTTNTSSASTKSNASASKAAATYAETVAKKTAMKATASASDKAAKKPN